MQVEEVVAWDCLIKWGIEQTFELEDKNNREEWTDQNYEDLKITLSDFIPLIRFEEFSFADYVDKVRPYKAIIPNHIYEKVDEFYCKGTPLKIATPPPRVVRIESNIIKPELANIVANWIDKENFGIKYNSHYKFNLIYRGRHDGNWSKSFRSKCKGQIPSLVLIKVEGSDKIFGGYSSIGFSSIGKNLLSKYQDSNGWSFYYSSDNFIFSFENSEDIQNMKISRVLNNSRAMLDHSTNGFNFGWASLSINDKCLFANNRANNYEGNLKTEVVFDIEEIETFTVSKR